MTVLATLVLASLLQYVDPQLGTRTDGIVCPAASVPFGMVQAGPEKRQEADDRVILGFSHTHFCRTGVNGVTDMLMMPAVGLKTPEDSTFVLGGSQYASPYTAVMESAEPGCYGVFLEKPEIRVRLTAGHRIAVHEYSFKTGSRQQLVIDLNYGGKPLESSICMLPGSEDVLLVHRRTEDREVWYRLEFSCKVKKAAVGDGCAILNFGTAMEPLCVIVGMSFTSFDNASEAIALEWAEGFDNQKYEAEEKWDSYLGTIRCPYKDSRRKKLFYTALYRTALQPVLHSDASGEYRGMDGQLHTARDFERYTVLPLDYTARELHPLLAQISPELTADFINTFISVCRESGRMPEFEMYGKEHGTVGLSPAGAVVAEAARLGVRGFDLKVATQALIRSGFRKNPLRESYRRNGYVSAEDSPGSVELTLEFAYEDWCIAQVARRVAESTGNPDEADAFWSFHDKYMESAQNWRNVFDPVTRRMRARSNGRWAPIREDERVCCFGVPHDIIGLTRALGGPSAFCEKLDSMMASPCMELSDPRCRRIPHLYALAGRQEKSDSLVAQMMEACYTPDEEGYYPAEGFGALSAWYVRSAVGEYQVCPGEAPGTRTFIKKTIVTCPVFEMPSDEFTDPLTVSIVAVDAGCRAWYRTDDGDFLPYSGPFVVHDSCTLEAFSESLDGRQSPPVRSVLRRIDVNSPSND